MFKFKIPLPFLITLAALSVLTPGILKGDDDPDRKKRETGIYYKNDLGYSWGVLSDQRMSNLHYEGPGGVLNFGRLAYRYYYITEISFARLQYNYSRPKHQNTIVENPGAGVRFMHLRRIRTPGNYDFYMGAQANVFGNARIAQRLGNSFLFADMIGELRPQADIFLSRRFLWRDWNVEFSMAASLAGYTLRIPEYGVSFELDQDGGVKIQGFESNFLLPHNYNHITTGVFIRESFPGKSNPNWFKIGYIWDYYSMNGDHNLNMHNTLHQFVLELYFKIR